MPHHNGMTQRNHVIADLIRNPEGRRKSGCRIKRGMTEGNHVIVDSNRNSVNRRKTGYRIRCGMTQRSHVIADLIRNPEDRRQRTENGRKNVRHDVEKPRPCGLDPQSRE